MKKTPLETWLDRLPRLGRRPRLSRIAIEFVSLLALHLALTVLLARADLAEHLLFSGPEASRPVLVSCFLALRVGLLVFGAGWLAARLWLWFSHPDFGKRSRRRVATTR